VPSSDNASQRRACASSIFRTSFRVAAWPAMREAQPRTTADSMTRLSGSVTDGAGSTHARFDGRLGSRPFSLACPGHRWEAYGYAITLWASRPSWIVLKVSKPWIQHWVTEYEW
jgi:hypothetical protein